MKLGPELTRRENVLRMEMGGKPPASVILPASFPASGGGSGKVAADKL